ncbi:hypothetical protein SAICODRAFT_28326 [Saitoella complicata NRRL Y-17804]|uniref:Transcriptional regulatory protein RXT2 N-terminal domain-containing protein n=1 Tax=Saitoella complicata (strain BCRC 22490 / CBS 7301 / JCM 7358 / NBRC 10748 / NRRL Y-17804) TaxID=698492 RepID=A0A0E9NI26_SAICN|nr:uncharacterized protein SAICODRAFT_28326 [Saitoella complicata NRRL Y-17804]ODQ56005.1 hypothetical protein SAICODRAFT_28326 [Saitoella complicata NRRL Y-17804]GAO49351.1 hypothetical protein G7K_3502-t1 [Saitoella complicata NRRL Y-17804]
MPQSQRERSVPAVDEETEKQIIALKETLAARSDASDSDSSVGAATHNRGRKLKRKARFVHKGKLNLPYGLQTDREVVEYANKKRAIIRRRDVPTFKSTRKPTDSDDEEDDDQTEGASDTDPYAAVDLNALLRPIAHPSDLLRHPSYQNTFQRSTLPLLATQALDAISTEHRHTICLSRLLTAFLGDDPTWVLMEKQAKALRAQNEEEQVDEEADEEEEGEQSSSVPSGPANSHDVSDFPDGETIQPFSETESEPATEPATQLPTAPPTNESSSVQNNDSLPESIESVNGVVNANAEPAAAAVVEEQPATENVDAAAEVEKEQTDAAAPPAGEEHVDAPAEPSVENPAEQPAEGVVEAEVTGEGDATMGETSFNGTEYDADADADVDQEVNGADEEMNNDDDEDDEDEPTAPARRTTRQATLATLSAHLHSHSHLADDPLFTSGGVDRDLGMDHTAAEETRRLVQAALERSEEFLRCLGAVRNGLNRAERLRGKVLGIARGDDGEQDVV